MKVFVTILCLVSITAKAQSDCVAQRSANSYSPQMPASCISRLSADLSHRDALESSGRVLGAAVDIIPFANLARTYLQERYNFPNVSPDVELRLRNYLNEYVSNVDYGREQDPEAIYKIFDASISVYMELNDLLNDSKFSQSERQLIQTKMMELKFLSEQSILNLSQKKNAQLASKIESLEKELATKLGKLDYQKFMGQLSALNQKISAIQDSLNELNKDPEKNKEKIAELSKEYQELKSTLKKQNAITTQDIKNYTQFAQGMVAIYSLFNPEEASRINFAVTGVSNIALGIEALSSKEALSAGATMGAYGLVAMGAVQVFSAMKSQKSSGEAFKAIFQQLKMISKQIEQLQKRMDSRFNQIDETLFQLEKKLFAELGRISTKVDDLSELVDYSNKILSEIDRNFRELSIHVVNESIENRIHSRYKEVVHKCIGVKTANVDLKKDELRSCLDSFSLWISNEITSELLTRKTLSAQYEMRKNFGFQINDLTSDFKHFDRQDSFNELANPVLLQDVADSLNILKLKYSKRLFYKQILEHEVFGIAQKLEDDLNGFKKQLKNNEAYLLDLKKRHKASLFAIHQNILDKQKDVQGASALGYHQKRLDTFRETLKKEIEKRGEERKINPQDSSLDQIVSKDFNTTLSYLKQSYEQFKEVKYETNILELINQNQIHLFIENCRATNSLNVMLPFPVSFLKSKLGDKLAQRILLTPERGQFCYNLDLKKDVPLFSYHFKYGANDEFKKENISNEGDVSTNFRQSLMIIRANSAPTTFSGKASGVYNGDFLASITIEGQFEGERILSEKKVFKSMEKLAWRNKASDPYSLLTLVSEGTYHRQYPYYSSPNYRGIETAWAPTNRSCNIFGGQNCLNIWQDSQTIEADVQNTRTAVLKRDQTKLLDDVKTTYLVSTSKTMKDHIEKLDMADITETGRLLTLAMYFRDPVKFNQDSELNSKLSEVWGLRSAPFLKKLYYEAISFDPSEGMIEYVYKNQTEVLDSIK